MYKPKNLLAEFLEPGGMMAVAAGFVLAVLGFVFATSTYPWVQSKVILGATLVSDGFLIVIAGFVAVGIGKLITFLDWEKDK